MKFLFLWLILFLNILNAADSLSTFSNIDEMKSGNSFNLKEYANSSSDQFRFHSFSLPDSTNHYFEDEYVPKWYSMFTNVPGDWADFYHQHITVDRIPLIIGISVSTAVLIATDDKTWRASDKLYRKNSFNKNVSDFFVEFGDGRSQFAFAACFAAGGLLFKDQRALRTSIQIVEGVLACGSFVQVLKHLTGRESPFVSTKTGGAWRFFPNQIDYHKHVPHYDAFPSGHIATSMAAFIIISENYSELKWIEPLGWVAASFIGIAMVNQGIHWYSDYPLGIALGYAFGKIVAHPDVSELTKSTEHSKTAFTFSPYFGYQGNGISFQVNF